MSYFRVGLDVGSTTVKAVVLNEAGGILWRHYARHDSRQAEKAIELMERWESEVPGFRPRDASAYVTGSGGSAIAEALGGRFVQEVHAVSLAVERLHPNCSTVIELGGQDAKIILFQEAPGGARRKLPSMNDKCAGGTGAVIDKIRAKLSIPAESLGLLGYNGQKLHHVAGKCGVFAETDINGLQKSGIPAPELMASLYEAIVLQNLTVLTRGNTPRPDVLLLGGPNTFLLGLRECWRHHLTKLWRERGISFPEDPEQCILSPEGSEYFAAYGAALETQPGATAYRGAAPVRELVASRSTSRKGAVGLWQTPEELEQFRQRYRRQPFEPVPFRPGDVVDAYLGIDGGSTSTKAVLVAADASRAVLATAYRLSGGNPIEDTQQVLASLESQIRQQGATLRVRGAGVTGYAKDTLRDVLRTDASVVETVAHTQAGLHFEPGVDVICDVGGQDIKIIMLKDGVVKDFRLNTQCSAGNGYFLQSTAETLGYRVTELAEAAFRAETIPEFGYGCAVFMQSDIVNFQRQGWRPEEILAGLCAVLPKNIWLYVAQIPNLAALGRRFLLQGGTQHNLAAVKAQVDFIESRFRGGAPPEVIVHPFCGEAGAIGAALEAGRVVEHRSSSSFIGMDAAQNIRFQTTSSEATRCYFCPNHCLRTFIDVETGTKQPAPIQTKVPLAETARRIIVATCEKGKVEDAGSMRAIKSTVDETRSKHPNLADHAAHAAFRAPSLAVVMAKPSRWAWTATQRARDAARARRAKMRIGMPRVLNMYSLAPLFNAYFVSLGIAPENLIWSDFTSEDLYRDGAKRGAVDPCFPSKLGIPHVHNLLTVHQARRPLDMIFFPMLDCLPTHLRQTQDSRACPTVTATPEAVKAAFLRESDLFGDHGIRYVNPVLDPGLAAHFANQLFDALEHELGLARQEHLEALAQAWNHLSRYEAGLRNEARDILTSLEREQRLGIVLLGRPYHNDPGVNHGILEEFQKLGYPVLTQDSLPLDDETLRRVFAGDEWPHSLGVGDVWKNSYSENTNRKVWAAKFVARHPNLIALELSNFKCGHDAPIYSLIEEIVERAGKPFFSFRDIDENRPAGAIRIRTETIAYFLERYRERISGGPALSLRLELAPLASSKSAGVDVPLTALLANHRGTASTSAPNAIAIHPKIRSSTEGGSRRVSSQTRNGP